MNTVESTPASTNRSHYSRLEPRGPPNFSSSHYSRKRQEGVLPSSLRKTEEDDKKEVVQLKGHRGFPGRANTSLLLASFIVLLLMVQHFKGKDDDGTSSFPFSSVTVASSRGLPGPVWSRVVASIRSALYNNSCDSVLEHFPSFLSLSSFWWWLNDIVMRPLSEAWHMLQTAVRVTLAIRTESTIKKKEIDHLLPHVAQYGDAHREEKTSMGTTMGVCGTVMTGVEVCHVGLREYSAVDVARITQACLTNKPCDSSAAGCTGLTPMLGVSLGERQMLAEAEAASASASSLEPHQVREAVAQQPPQLEGGDFAAVGYLFEKGGGKTPVVADSLSSPASAMSTAIPVLIAIHLVAVVGGISAFLLKVLKGRSLQGAVRRTPCFEREHNTVKAMLHWQSLRNDLLLELVDTRCTAILDAVTTTTTIELTRGHMQSVARMLDAYFLDCEMHYVDLLHSISSQDCVRVLLREGEAHQTRSFFKLEQQFLLQELLLIEDGRRARLHLDEAREARQCLEFLLLPMVKRVRDLEKNIVEQVTPEKTADAAVVVVVAGADAGATTTTTTAASNDADLAVCDDSCSFDRAKREFVDNNNGDNTHSGNATPWCSKMLSSEVLVGGHNGKEETRLGELLREMPLGEDREKHILMPDTQLLRLKQMTGCTKTRGARQVSQTSTVPSNIVKDVPLNSRRDVGLFSSPIKWISSSPPIVVEVPQATRRESHTPIGVVQSRPCPSPSPKLELRAEDGEVEMYPQTVGEEPLPSPIEWSRLHERKIRRNDPHESASSSSSFVLPGSAICRRYHTAPPPLLSPMPPMPPMPPVADAVLANPCGQATVSEFHVTDADGMQRGLCVASADAARVVHEVGGPVTMCRDRHKTHYYRGHDWADIDSDA